MEARNGVFSLYDGKAVGYVEFKSRKTLEKIKKVIKQQLGLCQVTGFPCGRGAVGAAAALDNATRAPVEDQLTVGCEALNQLVVDRVAKKRAQFNVRQVAAYNAQVGDGIDNTDDDEADARDIRAILDAQAGESHSPAPASDDEMQQEADAIPVAEAALEPDAILAPVDDAIPAPIADALTLLQQQLAEMTAAFHESQATVERKDDELTRFKAEMGAVRANVAETVDGIRAALLESTAAIEDLQLNAARFEDYYAAERKLSKLRLDAELVQASADFGALDRAVQQEEMKAAEERQKFLELKAKNLDDNAACADKLKQRLEVLFAREPLNEKGQIKDERQRIAYQDAMANLFVDELAGVIRHNVSIARVAALEGYYFDVQQICEVGKVAARRHYHKYGRKPSKHEQWHNGWICEVSTYYAKHIPDLKGAILSVAKAQHMPRILDPDYEFFVY